jgi:poly-gamma-glutamate capsule biosynthesis protein CapA/YwtB (metallophosphatase superfamily)
MSNTTTLRAVGDVRISFTDPKVIFEHVQPTLSAADIAFCQLETVYSTRGERDPHSRISFRAAPEEAPALKAAGFDVISLAGNHCMDYGHDALFDTIKYLRAAGLKTAGTGANLAEAAEPAIIEHNGNRVGFLSYNSIMSETWCAEANRPGCNPMKIYSSDGKFNSGETSQGRRLDTAAGPEALAAMARSLKDLKSRADVAVVSIHWGLALSPADLAGYQRALGHALIDAGADLVLGHHPHVLKAVEVYKGKAIFHSIGNFAFDQSKPLSAAAQALCPGYFDDPEYVNYKFPVDSRRTMMINCTIVDRQLRRVAVRPAYINPHAQPLLLSREDKRFDEVVDYLKFATTFNGLPADFSVVNDEVVITA